MDEKGQVSFEYLLTIVFAILLVIVVTIFALNLKNLSTSAEKRVADYTNRFFKNVFG